MDIIALIAEHKIQEAMKRGEFDNLSGMGKPLAMNEDLSGVPAETRMAYKVLKNAGFIPPELELRKEIASMGEMINTLDDDEQRRKKRKELDFKLLKLAMMRNRPVNLDLFPEYQIKVVSKCIG